ncbi:putative pheophorbide a oxygenase [Helianthus annuus]|nr:putative pheophorbide a oxygenase [Helianthus annuus]
MSCVDREGGRPLDLDVQQIDKNGFTAIQPYGRSQFVAPCLYYGYYGSGITTSAGSSDNNTKGKVAQKPARRTLLIFICMPVSPGNSRVMMISPRNYNIWMDRLLPRWMFHTVQNLVIDSDLYLLHVEEKKIMEAGPSNWQKLCFVPTKSDANVVAFRKWLKIYAGGQIDWGNKFTGSLPPTPPREQLMDRYWSHVVNCSSCNAAYKGLNALAVSLQVFSFALVAIVGATKQAMISMAARNTLVIAAVLCFVGSKWLSHFIYKTFRYHGYNHAAMVDQISSHLILVCRDVGEVGDLHGYLLGVESAFTGFSSVESEICNGNEVNLNHRVITVNELLLAQVAELPCCDKICTFENPGGTECPACSTRTLHWLSINFEHISN